MIAMSINMEKLPKQVRAALDTKDLEKIRDLAKQYSDGIGIRKNRKIAFVLFLAGAKLRDSELTWHTADALEYGLGVEKSLIEAEKYYKQASRFGSLGAVTALAHLYWSKGTDENLRKAIILYKRAARKNEPHALHNIGVCYSSGLGLKVNLSLAFKYFTRSAKNGHLEAAFKVGWCYLHGEGVRKNIKEGLSWLRYASMRGHREAIKLLERIS